SDAPWIAPRPERLSRRGGERAGTVSAIKAYPLGCQPIQVGGPDDAASVGAAGVRREVICADPEDVRARGLASRTGATPPESSSQITHPLSEHRHAPRARPLSVA